MNRKMRLMVLIAIAILLIVLAVTIQSSDSKEVSIKRNVEGNGLVTGNVGITVLSPEIDDKLAGENNEK
jgi:hypothetical protein